MFNISVAPQTNKQTKTSSQNKYEPERQTLVDGCKTVFEANYVITVKINFG